MTNIWVKRSSKSDKTTIWNLKILDFLYFIIITDPTIAPIKDEIIKIKKIDFIPSQIQLTKIT